MKKNISPLLILLCFLLINQKATAQIDSSQLSPHHIAYNHELDSLVDKEGNKFAMEDLAVGHKLGDESKLTSQLLCTSGYFNLWFEQGCGMDGSSAIEVARRNVLCRVFYDLSQLINRPAGSTTNVNIWVRDINMLAPNPCSQGVLGLATSFYPVPLGVSGGGIADNLVWQTINSGVDAYTNLTPPVTSLGGGTGVGFYHGMVAFNFNGCFDWWPAASWSAPLSLCPAPTTAYHPYDLYTVCLHEVTHALGFASLIDGNGASRFGAGINYYSRYDLFLKTSVSGGNLPLITNTGSCSLYNYSFNSSIAGGTAVLNPGCAVGYPTNSTTCSNAIRYVSAANPSQPVYTPNCYEPGSSLSHFEDMCANSPSTYSVCNNITYPGGDCYFTMSNANGPGTNKRFLQEEEKNVLCDIGYSLSSTYGDNLQIVNSYKSYTSSCAGRGVVGINDGITPSLLYQFVGIAGGTVASISGSIILSNDYDSHVASPYHPNNFECLEDMTDPTAVLSATSGTSLTTITISATLAHHGQHLLRYIPYDLATGIRGNITYIVVFFQNGNCVPSPCYIVANGSFENVTHTSTPAGTGVACSPISMTICNFADCWDNLANTYDCYSSSSPCTTSDNSYPAKFFSPSTATTSLWAPNPNAASNTTFIGLGGYYESLSANYIEAIANQLSSPLIPGQQYVLKLMVKGGNKKNHHLNNVLRVMASTTTLPPVPSFITSYFSNPNVPDIAHTILVPNSTVIGASTSWTPVNYLFTCPSVPGGGNLTYLVLVIDNQQEAGLYGPVYSGSDAYIYIDDVSIEPSSTSVTLALPASTSCTNTALIPNLATYLNPSPMPGGVFTGHGVSLSGGIYSYDPIAADIAGGHVPHIITYTYTDINGCSHSTHDQIWGGSPAYTVSLVGYAGGVEPQFCTGIQSKITATATGGSGNFTFAWSTACGNILNITSTLTTSTIDYSSISVPCIYTVTVTDNVTGCVITSTYSATSPGAFIFSSSTFTSSLPPVISGANILIAANTTITVNSNFMFDNCNVTLGANAIIDVQAGRTLDIINSSHLHACQTMWNGINVNSNATVNLFSSSILEQAKYGITSINGGIFKLNNAFMYNNYVHILVQPNTTTNTSTIQSSVLDGKHLITNLLAPYNVLAQTEKGVYILDNFSVTIGVPTAGLGNTITNADYGIYINNNVFANTNKTFIYNNTITNASKIGIYDSSASTNPNNKYLTVGNNSLKVPYLNTLNNCFYGIRSVRTNNSICNNDITGGLRAITCRFNYLKPQRVCNNDIHLPREVGISMEYSTQNTADAAGTQRVDYNNIWMNSTGTPCGGIIIILPGGGTAPTKPCYLQTAIRHLDITSNYNGRFQINYNNIYQPDRGIYISGGKYDLVSNNTINLPSPQVMGRVEGVLTSISTNVVTQYNTVNKPSWANPGCISGYSNKCTSVGLAFFNSTNSLVQCNTTNFTSRGFESNNTTTNTYYKGNIMNTNEVGWWRMNNSFPGHQGTATNCWGNQWTGGLYSATRPQTLTYNTPTCAGCGATGLIHTNIYVPALPPNPSFHSVNNYHDGASGPTYFNELSSSNIIFSCSGGGGTGGGGNPTTPTFNYNDNGYISYAELVATDALQYPEYPDEARYYDVQHLLEVIREDATLLQNDIIDSFYTETEDENINRFLDVEAAIAAGTLQDAGQILNDIEPDGIIEENRRQLYEIYLNTIAIENDEFTEEQRNALLQLAFQCPYTGGTAVIQARNMLALTDSTNYDDSLLCGEGFAYRQGSHQSTIKFVKHISESNNYFSVYPNPTNSIAFIKWNLTSDCNNCTIKIVNVLGEVVKEQKGLSQRGKLEFSTNSLPAGIYHCLLVTNNTVTESKKLVIVK